jgi:hypothetical protein
LYILRCVLFVAVPHLTLPSCLQLIVPPPLAANQSFRNLADKIEHIVGQALQLRPAHPKHLSLATHMGQAIVSFSFLFWPVPSYSGMTDASVD